MPLAWVGWPLISPRPRYRSGPEDRREGEPSLLITHLAAKVRRPSPRPRFLFSRLFASSEDRTDSPPESGRVQLDGVQRRWNRRGESQPPRFSMKENVIPGECRPSERPTCQTRAPHKPRSSKGTACYTTPQHCAWRCQDEARGHVVCALWGSLSRAGRWLCGGTAALTCPGVAAVGNMQGMWQ